MVETAETESEVRLRIAKLKGYRWYDNGQRPIALETYRAYPVYWDGLGAQPEPSEYCDLKRLPAWTREETAAWSLVEEMRQAGIVCEVLAIPEERKSKNGAYEIKLYDADLFIHEVGETAPLTICRGWLAWQERIHHATEETGVKPGEQIERIA